MWSFQLAFPRKFIFISYLCALKVLHLLEVHIQSDIYICVCTTYIGVTQCESFGFCQIQSYSFAQLLLLLFSHARFTSCSHHVRRGLLHIRYIHFHFVFLNKFALLYFCAANLSSLSRLWIFRVYICDVGKYLWLISNNLVNALVCRDMLSHHHSCLKHMENVCTDFRM